MVEQRNGGIKEWWNKKMVEQRNGGTKWKWWNKGMVEQRNGGTKEWWNKGTVEQRNGGTKEWWNKVEMACNNCQGLSDTRVPQRKVPGIFSKRFFAREM